MPAWGIGLGAVIGLSLLLVGLRVLSEGVNRAIRPSIRSGIAGARSTASGFLPGLFFAGIAQSSSAVAATTVGLAHAGALSFERAFAVILGANVGTTLTAQLSALAVSSTRLPLAIVACGLALRVAAPVAAARSTDETALSRAAAYGTALTGLGAVLMGLHFLGRSLTPLVHLPGVLRLLTEAAGHPTVSVALGAAVTAIAQSSSAVSATVVQLSDAGSIPLETSLALVLGSNVGTVATTLLAAVGLSPAAKKTAAADLLFNVTGVCIALLFFPAFVYVVSLLSPDPGRRVAHAHTLFNVLTAAVALPFLHPFVKFVDRLVAGARRG